MSDFSQIDARLEEWIDTHSEEMIASLQGLLRIPSVLGTPAEGAPFGIETKQALDYVLDQAKEYGLTTKMVEGYAAHAEFGSGSELIGVLGHVDVVPAGNDWTHDPFGGEVVDGKIFSRGAIDDKGPTIAGFYAILALKEIGFEPQKRIRLIIGADEESGFRCVHYYFEHEEMPTVGFTPDGAFPAIYAEKGIASPTISAPIPTASGTFTLLSLSGGNRANMVPDRATALLAFEPVAIVPIQELLEKFPGITTEVEIDRLTVLAEGVSAHGSTPEKGINAVGRLADALLALPGLAVEHKALLAAVHSFAVDNSGASLGIEGSDEVVGPLTSNLGVATTLDESIRLTFSIRYPVTWSGNDVRGRLESAIQPQGFELADWKDSPPLYVPMDDPFLQTLIEVYRTETGDLQPPKTTGGGTYARALKKGVAFGADFPGFPMIAHQADEFWYIADFIKSAKIFAKALARLSATTTFD